MPIDELGLMEEILDFLVEEIKENPVNAMEYIEVFLLRIRGLKDSADKYKKNMDEITDLIKLYKKKEIVIMGENIELTDGKLLDNEWILRKIKDEKTHQLQKWGVQTHHPFAWLAFITEEVGEASEAISEYLYRGGHIDRIVNELIQAATLCLTLAEAFEQKEEFDRSEKHKKIHLNNDGLIISHMGSLFPDFERPKFEEHIMSGRTIKIED